MGVHGRCEKRQIKRANEIGYKGYNKYIWCACEDCGKERWVHLISDKPESVLCHKCATANRPKWKLSHAWRGGIHQASNGYIRVALSPEDFFYPMTTDGRALEHRFVMAKHLGRCLHSWEIVHHKNHIKNDNRIENLQLVSEGQHQQITMMENEIAKLKQRITLLEAENVLIVEQMKRRGNCEHTRTF